MNRPVITRALASEICTDRMAQLASGDPVPSLGAFAVELCQSGTLPRVFSRVSLSRLLNGHMFPDLEDLEGNKIDWARMPSAHRSSPRNYTLASHQTAICQLQRDVAALLRREIRELEHPRNG